MSSKTWQRGGPVGLQDSQDMTKEWVEKATDGDIESMGSIGREIDVMDPDTASLELEALKKTRDKLKMELREKDKIGPLWKKQENDYQNQITELTKKMDEMSRKLRNRDIELEKLKMRESKFKQEIDVLTVKAKMPSTSVRARLAENRIAFPQPTQSSRVPRLKFPTIGNRQEEGVTQSDSTLEISKPGKRKDRTSLPSISPTDQFAFDGKTKKIRTDSSFGPRNVHPCFLCEKWVTKTGGKLSLPNINLVIPPKAVDSGPLLVTATELQSQTALKQKLFSTGLNKYIQPCVAMVLQPHGYEFLRPVKIELKNVRLGSEKILVFHKDVNHHRRTAWVDITSECAPKNTKDGMVLTTRQFCVLETMKLLLPPVTLPTQATHTANTLMTGQTLQSLSISTHVTSVLYDRIASCEFHIFQDKTEDCISVICLKISDSPEHTRDLLSLPDLKDRRDQLVRLGTAQGAFQLCDKERLFVYFEKKQKYECSFVFRQDEAESKGQLIMVPLSGQGKVPRKFSIRRKVADFVEDIEITSLRLNHPRTGGTSLSESATVDNVLLKTRKKIVVNVDVRFLLDQMRQEKVFTIQEQDHINQETTRQARAKIFVDLLAQKGKRAMLVFCNALKDDYKSLADEIYELMKEEPLDGDVSDTASSAPLTTNSVKSPRKETRVGKEKISSLGQSNSKK